MLYSLQDAFFAMKFWRKKAISALYAGERNFLWKSLPAKAAVAVFCGRRKAFAEIVSAIIFPSPGE